MYAHGFATLFLAEAALRCDDAELRQRLAPVLQRAVRMTEQCQNEEGGWRYFPRPHDADTSVTACQLDALVAARAAGADVSDDSVRRVREYLHRARNADGGYAYMVRGRGASELPRSAAAVAALLNAGEEPAGLETSLRYLASASPRAAWQCRRPTYAHFYLALALGTPGGAGAAGESAAAYDAYEAALLERQAPDGRWHFEEPGPAGATAMALVALQMRHRPLRAFRRGNAEPGRVVP